ncbi:MAG: hypothetical protein JW958_06535 [Candidatus Eisenbacteria bacterium]|nr:hypothetical protein [Candidatus Eisenbacteria bacterium]
MRAGAVLLDAGVAFFFCLRSIPGAAEALRFPKESHAGFRPLAHAIRTHRRGAFLPLPAVLS